MRLRDDVGFVAGKIGSTGLLAAALRQPRPQGRRERQTWTRHARSKVVIAGVEYM
jgi:hypothetical protein